MADIISEDHKILIFSQFVKSLTHIREWLEEEEIEYSYLDGSTKDRKSEIDAFQEDPNRKVFLISLKAGGTGINLTAADYVLIFDPWWNPAAEAQAIDRTHRIGQTRPVTAFRLIMKGTIEEKILELQNKKRKLMEDLITTEDSIFKEMSRKIWRICSGWVSAVPGQGMPGSSREAPATGNRSEVRLYFQIGQLLSFRHL